MSESRNTQRMLTRIVRKSGLDTTRGQECEPTRQRTVSKYLIRINEDPTECLSISQQSHVYSTRVRPPKSLLILGRPYFFGTWPGFGATVKYPVWLFEVVHW
jgi:hypothetical protein